ncbi:flagellar hook-length control protein FliK [Comamonas testosteroni]|uniref:Flagellar hook-length control protein FliK n=1 Tax=Comamonas testosteroni TaxID=285 RepID=A0A373FI98_COMTE|nr:flagellar hook-length control protein FliK [Comamonas testosteroni]RGE43215.1 flagellar hook-length control protein FliK [Comamonas testosteroni]
MADTRIESPRSGEPRISKAAQSMASARTAGAGDQPAQGFSSLLASLDSFAATGLPQALVPDEAQTTTTTDLTPLNAQDQLLASQVHAPWMSLVGQTARLDTQGDADLRQGVASDFLSGRGNSTLLAHRQALDPAAAQAHAGVLPDSESNEPQVHDLNTLNAINFDDSATAALTDKKAQTAESAAISAAMADIDKTTSRAEPAQPQRPVPVASQGISLQGMTAVAPQTAEHLKELLRSAKSESASVGAEKTGSVTGGSELLAAAAGFGAAMGAASAGMQGQGQSASDLSQSANPDAMPSEREQEVSEQVAFWVHQKTQNAALSIEHQGKPIQVQVQLNGQEAHVRFAAGDEQARQWLAQGQDQLRELLQAQGLNLSGVSVGADGAGQQQSQADAHGRQPVNAAITRVGVQNAAGNAGNTGLARQAQGSVDLFV